MSLVLGGVAWADDISNNLDADVDAAAEVMNLTAGGTNGSTQLFVVPRNGDGKNGCNLTGSTTLVVSVNSSNTSVTTVSPSSITFGTCDDTPTVTVTPVGAGASTISLTQTSNTTDGTFNLAPATFSVNVAAASPSDTTAPAISYELDPASPDGDNGWYVSDVALTWMVVENESPSSLVKTGCVDQNITTDQAATTYSCSATSDGGSAGPVDVSIKRDATAPTVAYTSASPAANSNGWYNTDVTATFTATDNLSGFDSLSTLTTTDTSTTSGEGTSVTVGSPVFTDHAGNSAAAGTATSDGFKIDKTAPVVSVTGVSDGATYILGSVPPAGCETTDALSGVATVASLSTLGGPLGSITATCSGALDNAGNSGSASATYSVIYAWNGFFRPIDNLPTINKVKAGSAIPVKFSLSGDQGLAIFETGSPVSKLYYCDGSEPYDTVETVTAGNSSLSYDALSDQYTYVWKTDKSWAGTCRQLSVKLIDGTSHWATFSFTK